MVEPLSKELRLLRLEYVETTVEVLQEASLNPLGAQERVAERRGKEASVISNHVSRVAKAFGASFFEPDRDRNLSPAGVLMLHHGRRMLNELERFGSSSIKA